jgi:TP901 family phage tail tape measure protein
VAGESRRDLIFKMRADPEGFKKGMKEASGSARGFYTQLKRLEEQQASVDTTMTSLGQGMMVTGAAIGVGLGLAARAAIQWESAWTGVAKVVDGTPEQMEALEGELRSLATTLPQTHAEIAGVAAAAGQLGIAREDISEFTQVMVAMGVSTDIASEDAAMGMARLMNIMQTAPADVQRLGSAIVGLGNDGASTESEILNMALRIAGAGKTVGMTEAEVLGFASALASVGIEAESGGSSVSTAMIKISEAVSEGGESLEQFAAVAGLSADEFASKFRSSPAAAMDLFVQGLGRIQSSGGDVFATLKQLGMSDIQLRDAMLRLAGAGDLLTESLATGNDAWRENSALMEEALRRYGTAESQIGVARNQLTEMGIQLGETLLPIINDFLLAGSGFFAWFNDLSPAVKEFVVQLGLAATVIGLVGGAALMAAPKLAALSVSLGAMGGGTAKAAGTALGGILRVMGGPWGLVIGAGAAVIGKFAMEQAEAKGRVEALTNSLDAQTGAVTDNTRVLIANELEQRGVIETANDLGVSLATMVDAIEGDPAAMQAVNDAIARRREELIELAGTSEANLTEIDAERGALTHLQEVMGGVSDETQEAIDQKQRQIELQEGATDSTKQEASATQILAEQLGIATDQVDEATAASQEFDAALQALRDTMFGSKDAQAALTLEVGRATEAFEENGNSLDVNSEAGALNHQAVMGLIAANHELISAEAESGATAEELAGITDDLRGDFINLMKQAGFSEEAIQEYADAFDEIPASKTTTLIQELVTVGQWNAPSSGILPQYATGGLVGFPNGGMLRGPGTGTSDSMLIRASNGEFVVNAEATSQNRALLEAINSGQTLGTAMRHVPASHRGMGGMGSAGAAMVRVWFDFTNVSGSLERAIKDSVVVNGGGNVQIAFGSR